jgi:hypothetical protein
MQIDAAPLGAFREAILRILVFKDSRIGQMLRPRDLEP